MYFANSEGVLVYDGKYWELIKVSNKSQVRSLAIDDNGRIYVGGIDEFGYLAYDSSGKLNYVSLLNLLPEKNLNFNQIWKIAVGEDGIYFGAENKYFYLHKDKLRVTSDASNRGWLFSLFGQVIHAHRKQGLHLLNHGKSRLLPHCQRFNDSNSGALALLPYKDKKILICTEKEGIFLYDLQWLFQEKNARPYPPEKFPNDISHYLMGNKYIRAEKLGENQYAFINWKIGIAIMDQRGKLIREVNKTHGLATNDLNNIFPGRAGNLWAMSNKGLSYVETGSPVSFFSDSLGLEETVLSVIKHDDTLYAGTFGGAFYLAKNKFLPVKNAQEQTFDFYSRGGILLAGGQGVSHIDGNIVKEVLNEDLFVYRFGRSGKFPDHVFCIGDPGFYALKIQPGNTTHIPAEKFADLKADSVRNLIADGQGNFWLSTLVGELIYLRFTGTKVTDYEITRYSPSHGVPRGLFYNFGYLNGVLIAFNKEGVFKLATAVTAPDWDPDSARFEKVSSFNGLAVDSSINLNPDHYHKGKQIFVYSNRAAGLLTGKRDGGFTWNPIPFKKAVGMLIGGQEFMDHRGVLWKGSSNGLFRYDPAVKKDYRADFPVLIKKVIIDDSRVIFNGTYYDPATKMTRKMTKTGDMEGNIYTGGMNTQPPDMIHTLEYKDNSITFQYAATFFEKQSATRFSYRLEGYKDKWSSWTAENKAVYTNLPGGRYCFRVRAKNIFGHESAPARYGFIISPPWNLTGYAYVCYIFAFILLLYVSIKLYSRRLVAAKLRLEKIVAQRTEEIKKQTEQLKVQNTEITKQREAAETANHSKSMFLARMSHEIRTPINGVIGFAEMLMDTKLNEEQSDYAQTIANSGEVLLNLVDDILDFSKIEAGKLSFENIDFDLEVMAFDICHLILPRIGDRPVEIICTVGDKVPAFVNGDAARLRQVLGNLLVNAVKFTNEGEIQISIDIEEQNDDKLLLHARVRDTGIGIPKDKQNVIFEDYQQADGSTARKYGGTGLGLAICKQIAQLMGGALWVESEPGKGSTFHFTARVSKSQKTVSEKKLYLSLKGKRGLIADGNSTNLKILAHYLETMDMQPVVLDNGKAIIPTLIEAIEQGNPFDICILDIKIASPDGYELARRIRAHADKGLSQLPLLAVSSSTGKEAKLVLESGFDAFLPKPVSRPRLKRMMEKMFEPGTSPPETEAKNGRLLTRYSLEEEEKHSVSILLAEDNPINRKLAIMMLTKAGYRLETSNNGREAVDMFTAAPDKFDLILMDVNMPEMDGLQATKEIREKGFDIPIIAITADAMKGDREKCIEAGMNDYIVKPIKREEIFQIVKKWGQKSNFMRS